MQCLASFILELAQLKTSTYFTLSSFEFSPFGQSRSSFDPPYCLTAALWWSVTECVQIKTDLLTTCQTFRVIQVTFLRVMKD